MNKTPLINSPALWRKYFPLPTAKDNKYTRGRCVILGGAEMTGASRLAALAAARAGAGMTVISSPVKSAFIYKIANPSLIVETYDFAKTLTHKKTNAVLLGPGAGKSPNLKKKVFKSLALCKSVILDADALSVFKNNPDELFKKLRPTDVLTPHEGEFDRLFGKNKTDDKMTRAVKAAKKSGAIIVFKGSDTIIASPDGRVVINKNAPATLATAGSGDVLAGLITGFVSQGMPSFFASCCAVWLCSEAAKIHGRGLIAEDIISYIPQILNRLFPLPKTST